CRARTTGRTANSIDFSHQQMNDDVDITLEIGARRRASKVTWQSNDSFWQSHGNSLAAPCRASTASSTAAEAVRLRLCWEHTRPHVAGVARRRGIVTLTLDGRAGARDGSAARIMSRIGRTSPVAKHQMPRTYLH